MGWHWVDLLSPEFHGATFTSTMVYGYYEGKLAFYEPMVTQAFFRSRPQFSSAIRQPQSFPKPGYYPTGYSISYQSATDSFEIKLNGLVYRQ